MAPPSEQTWPYIPPLPSPSASRADASAAFSTAVMAAHSSPKLHKRRCRMHRAERANSPVKIAAKQAAPNGPVLSYSGTFALTKSAAAAAATAACALLIASSSSTHANLQQLALLHSSDSSLSKRQSLIATMSASSELLAAMRPERAFTLHVEMLRLVAVASRVKPVLQVEKNRPPPLPPSLPLPQSAPQNAHQNRVPMALRTRTRQFSDLRDLSLPSKFGSTVVLPQQPLSKKASRHKPRRIARAPCLQVLISASQSMQMPHSHLLISLQVRAPLSPIAHAAPPLLQKRTFATTPYGKYCTPAAAA